jgi:hypothetical protein
MTISSVLASVGVSVVVSVVVSVAASVVVTAVVVPFSVVVTTVVVPVLSVPSVLPLEVVVDDPVLLPPSDVSDPVFVVSELPELPCVPVPFPSVVVVVVDVLLVSSALTIMQSFAIVVNERNAASVIAMTLSKPFLLFIFSSLTSPNHASLFPALTQIFQTNKKVLPQKVFTPNDE